MRNSKRLLGMMIVLAGLSAGGVEVSRGVEAAGGAGAAAGGAGGVGGVKAYEIKLERGFKKGDAFMVVITHSDKQTQKMELPDGSGQETASSKVVRLEGEMRVMEVDANGRDTLTHLVVRQLTTQSGDLAAVVVLNPGTELDVKYEGGAVSFTPTKLGAGSVSLPPIGAGLPDSVRATLGDVFPPHRERKATDDDKYGSKEPRKVGETWAVNGAVVASAGTQALDPAKISGTVAFKGVRVLSGVECAQVEVSVTVKDVPMPSGMPKESALTATISYDVPTDVSKPSMGTSSRSLMRLMVEQPLGQGMRKTIVNSDRTDRWTYVPMK